MSPEPESGALQGCGEAFICCLSQGESVLPEPGTGTARLKADKRRKGKITPSVQKDCVRLFMILF